jgi:cell division septal protein FtsQ
VDVALEQNAAHVYLFPKIKEALDQKLKPLYGQHILKIDLEKVLSAVEKDLRIKDATIARVLPNTIQVKISPYTPIANILSTRNNKFYPVARDGEVLPPVATSEVPDAPILRGEIFLKKEEIRIGAVELLKALPESGSVSVHTAAEITYDGKKGYQILLSSSALQIWMGFDDFASRISQAKRVVDYLESEKLSGRIIDARFGKKVVVKLRNAP